MGTPSLKWLSHPGVVCVVLLLVLASGCFAYSVHLRRPWFNTSPVCLETWLTAGAMMWARYWYREGAVKLRFGLYLDPDSIEFPTQESRDVYTSYPPGTMLPIYAVSKLLGREPSMAIVMAYNLFCHFVITALLSLLVFAFLRSIQTSYVDAFLLATIPIFIELLLPAPFFHHQISYFHDLSVLHIFVLYVVLEFFRDRTENRRARTALSLAQTVIAFFGILSDWLFAFVTLCLYLKRFVTGEIVPFKGTTAKAAARAFLSNSVRFWFSFVLALSLFVLQLYHFGQFGVLYSRFRERTGMRAGTFLAFGRRNHFWDHHMVRGYGETGRSLVYLSMIALAVLMVYAAYRLVRRKAPNRTLNRAVTVMFLILTPCLLQVTFLRQHSSHILHFFAAAKFALPLAIIPFVLLPVAVLAVFNRNLATFSVARIRALFARTDPAPRPRWSLLPPLLVVLAAYYVYGQSPNLTKQFLKPPEHEPITIGQFIDEHTAYEDVLFTQDANLETKTMPSRLAYNLKHVYRVMSLGDIQAKLQDVQGEYIVNFLVREENLPMLPQDLLRLLASAYRCNTFEGLLLYKVCKTDFLDIDQQPPPSG